MAVVVLVSAVAEVCFLALVVRTYLEARQSVRLQLVDLEEALVLEAEDV